MRRLSHRSLRRLSLLLALAGCGRMPGATSAEAPAPIAARASISTSIRFTTRTARPATEPRGQNGPAMDLANPEYLALADDATLRRIIANGMPGNADARLGAVRRRHAHRSADRRHHCRHAPRVVQAERLRRRHASAARTARRRQCAARPAALSGTLRHVPQRATSARSSPAPSICRWSAMTRCAASSSPDGPTSVSPTGGTTPPKARAADAPDRAGDHRHRCVPRIAAEPRGGFRSADSRSAQEISRG